MTFAANYITAILSAALVEQMIGGPWWTEACAGLLTGFVVMVVLIRVNPKP